MSNGLVFSEIKHQGPRKLPRHHHELAFFNLVLRGRYQEIYSDNEAALFPLSVIFTPPGVDHHDQIASGVVQVFSIELDRRWLVRLREHDLTAQKTVAARGSELTWLSTRLYGEYKDRFGISALTIEGIILEMLAIVGGERSFQTQRPPAWLSTVLDLLRAEFQSNLTVNLLASKVNVTPIHLSRVFRHFQKQTIGDYLHELRVQFAGSLLSEPELSLSAIAASSIRRSKSLYSRFQTTNRNDSGHLSRDANAEEIAKTQNRQERLICLSRRNPS